MMRRSFRTPTSKLSEEQEIQALQQILSQSRFSVAITGAGISLAAGIRAMDARTMPDAEMMISTARLQATPEAYYAAVHRWFLSAMFNSGPTLSHRALARLEERDQLHGVITTNLDTFHTMAGSEEVAEIQGSFGVNICLDCERRVDVVAAWNHARPPRCQDCQGLLAPFPTYTQGGLLQEEVLKARRWVAQAEAVIVIGTTGPYSMVYLDAIDPQARLVQINPQRTHFDRLAELTIRRGSDDVFRALEAADQG